MKPRRIDTQLSISGCLELCVYMYVNKVNISATTCILVKNIKILPRSHGKVKAHPMPNASLGSGSCWSRPWSCFLLRFPDSRKKHQRVFKNDDTMLFELWFAFTCNNPVQWYRMHSDDSRVTDFHGTVCLLLICTSVSAQLPFQGLFSFPLPRSLAFPGWDLCQLCCETDNLQSNRAGRCVSNAAAARLTTTRLSKPLGSTGNKRGLVERKEIRLPG